MTGRMPRLAANSDTAVRKGSSVPPPARAMAGSTVATSSGTTRSGATSARFTEASQIRPASAPVSCAGVPLARTRPLFMIASCGQRSLTSETMWVESSTITSSPISTSRL